MAVSIQRRTRDTFLWVLLIPILLGVLTFWAAGRYRRSMSWVSHTKDVLVAVQDVLVTITYAESSQRGFLITGDEPFRSRYASARDQLSSEIAGLRQLTRDNPRQQANLDRLSSEVRVRLSKLQQVILIRLQGHLPDPDAIEAMREGAAMMDDIRQICAAMKAEETRLLTERIEARQRTEIDVGVCFALGILISVILLYWAHQLIRQYSVQRDRAENTVRQLNADLEARVEARTAELAAANVRLSRSNDDLTRFAYVASHDLQEPLRTVGSYAGLLGRRYEGRLDAQADQYIRYIVDGAKRMQALVQDLLAYSRAGTVALNVAPIDMQAVLAQAKENLNITLVERRAKITNEPLPALKGDAGKLALVLQNLIGNAVKFTKAEQTPTVHMEAWLAGHAWIFSVRDNGVGFEQQYAERIFGIFQRLHRVGAYPGTGIGLAICKRIVEAHGGRIWAKSEPGVGSTFFFSLPADAEVTPAAGAAGDRRALNQPVNIGEGKA